MSIYIYMDICIHMYTYAYIYIYVYAYIYIHIYTCLHIFTHIYTCICMCKFTCIYTCIYMYIHVYLSRSTVTKSYWHEYPFSIFHILLDWNACPVNYWYFALLITNEEVGLYWCTSFKVRIPATLCENNLVNFELENLGRFFLELLQTLRHTIW